jgi:hypothetical protein
VFFAFGLLEPRKVLATNILNIVDRSSYRDLKVNSTKSLLLVDPIGAGIKDINILFSSFHYLQSSRFRRLNQQKQTNIEQGCFVSFSPMGNYGFAEPDCCTPPQLRMRQKWLQVCLLLHKLESKL